MRRMTSIIMSLHGKEDINSTPNLKTTILHKWALVKIDLNNTFNHNNRMTQTNSETITQYL